jgi:Tfp pilus assembly protein PilP
MQDLVTIVKENTELAERINREARSNPDSPYAGKYVGIANGKVAVVADTLTEAVRQLQQIERNRDRATILQASADYDKVQYIGGF